MQIDAGFSLTYCNDGYLFDFFRDQDYIDAATNIQSGVSPKSYINIYLPIYPDSITIVCISSDNLSIERIRTLL